MMMIKFLAPAAALLATIFPGTVRADALKTPSPFVTIEYDEVGFILHGNPKDGNLDRVLFRGRHPKVPFVEKLVVLRSDPGGFSTTFRVDTSLSDGTPCWIEIDVTYEINDPKRVFATAKAQGMLINSKGELKVTFDDLRADTVAAYRNVMPNVSPQDAANIPFGPALALPGNGAGREFEDGTLLIFRSLRDTNCTTFAARTLFPPKQESSPRCRWTGEWVVAGTLEDRILKKNGDAAKFYAKGFKTEEFLTKDLKRVRTTAPTIGLRPNRPYSWSALFDKKQDEAKKMAGNAAISAMHKKVAINEKENLAKAINNINLDDLAMALDEELEPLGYEVAEISFKDVSYSIRDIHCPDE